MSDGSAASWRIVVTGHSRGLGAAVCREALRRGAQVLGLARSTLTLAAGLDAVPGRWQQHLLDLGDAQAVTAWLAQPCLADFLAGEGPCLLLNNAGTVQPIGPAGSRPLADIVQGVSLNVTAPLLLTAAFIAATGHCRDRRIVHVSSGAARQAYAGWSTYCATKAALDRHAEAVALEGHPGLRICSLAPGVVDTDMQAEIRATPGERFADREKFVRLKVAGALSEPDEVARRLLDHALGPRCGEPVVADLRAAYL